MRDSQITHLAPVVCPVDFAALIPVRVVPFAMPGINFGLKRMDAESAFLHGPEAQNRPGSFSPLKPLIISRISGRGKKFAVAAMGEVCEDRKACPQGSTRTEKSDFI
ncbi:MAG: hypothetical protein LBV50_03130 [Novosphingobium sp.]|jgi:hypothetical protein|nr:hypothetical protein [Novosphingobium sp.]